MNIDLEKIMEGLEHCSNRTTCDSSCPYWYLMDDPNMGIDECTSQLARDALSLIKAQEPRVMTICEIQSFDGAVYVDEPKNPVCLKMLYCYEVGQRTYGHGYTFVDSDGDKLFYSAQGFGTKWRCWTARPTDEQREAVKWE